MEGKESKYEMNQKMMINIIEDGINLKQNHDSPLQHFLTILQRGDWSGYDGTKESTIFI